MSVVLAGLFALSALAIVPASAEGQDVRVILPFETESDGKAADYERVSPDQDEKTYEVADICDLIEASAHTHKLPKPFFARLIWKESRFDAKAVSPAGARGIAQFMPATALRRGLRDPFDPGQAIPASAAYLAELRDGYGNLGLAAAAYNAGEERVSRWLNRGGYLPYETQNYVLSILGKSAESFKELKTDEEQQPLHKEKPFAEACRDLPVVPTRATLYAGAPKPVWGVQVAGNFQQAVAMAKWNQVQQRYSSILEGREPAVFQKRSPIGRKSIFVVQVGASNRSEAEDLCGRLRAAGGSCLVTKN